ncbi:MAG: 5-carboxymethyl-2-hydroxymuconate isomerase [Planctomyces sp.]|nr:5-carboxymethyl-2-hydroxymuconate isomerase [Planctomyces sp.]
MNQLRVRVGRYGGEIELAHGVLAVRQVLGIGLNYAGHAKEQGQALPERPVVFSKSVLAVSVSGAPIRVPKACQDRAQVDFEGELAVVIGEHPRDLPCRDVPRERAGEWVLGYAAANDVSARWWQKQGSGGQFFRGKSFDTFCPLSAVRPAAGVPTPPGPGGLRITTRLNGVVMQDSTTADLIFDVPTLVAELSRGLTLAPGTVILTGTPSGVGMARSPQVFLSHGDEVEVTVEGVGTVRNAVVFE